MSAFDKIQFLGMDLSRGPDESILVFMEQSRQRIMHTFMIPREVLIAWPETGTAAQAGAVAEEMMKRYAEMADAATWKLFGLRKRPSRGWRRHVRNAKARQRRK